MVMSNLQKMLPMSQYDQDERRALDLADAEWRRSHSTNEDLTPAHKAFVISRAREVVKELPVWPETTGDLLSGNYDRNLYEGRSITKPYKPLAPISGSVEIDLGDFDPEWPNAFKPYNGGTTLQGPGQAAYKPPKGMVGDPTQYPGYRGEQERQARAREHAERGSGYIAGSAAASGAVSALKYTDVRPPAGSVGDPRGYPSRDGWRGPYTPGVNLAGAGEHYGKKGNG